MARLLLNRLFIPRQKRSMFRTLKESKESPLPLNKQKQTIADRLCQILKTGDEVDRCGISRTLGNIKATSATDALIDCLKDEDIDVCMDAAEALGRLGEPQGITALANTLLEDPNSEVKCAVTDALKVHKTPEVVSAMLNILQQSPDDMDSDDPDWNFGWDLQRKLAEALGEMKVSEAVPRLTQMLEDEFEDAEDIEHEILSALAKMGDQGENFIRKRLKQGSPRQKRRAASVLPQCQSRQSWEALIDAIHDKDHEVRANVVDALCRYPDSEKYLDLFLELLKDTNPEVRASILDALLQLKIKKTNRTKLIETVASLLSDEASNVRALAVYTLGQLTERLHHLNIDRKLFSSLHDPDPYVATAACKLIEQCQYSPAIPALKKLVQQRDLDPSILSQALRTLGKVIELDGEELYTFTPFLESEDPQVCLAALNALDEVDKRSSVAPVTPTNTESKPVSALDSLLQGLNGTLHNLPEETPNSDAVSVPPPTDNSHSIDATSTMAAIERDNIEAQQRLAANGNLPDDSTPLQEILDDDLAEYGTIVDNNIEQRQTAKDRRKNPVVNLRHLCARVLANSDRLEALAALMDNAQDQDPRLVKECLNSIAVILERNTDLNLPAELFDLLLTKAEDADIENQLCAIRCLGLLGDDRVVTPLIRKLNHSDSAICSQAIRALSILLKNQPSVQPEQLPVKDKQGDSALVYQAIYSLLGDSRSLVRRTAAEALSHLGGTGAIDGIIAAAALDDGSQARVLGKSIRNLAGDIDISDSLIQALNNCINSNERKVIVEMIEEIYKDSSDKIT